MKINRRQFFTAATATLLALTRTKVSAANTEAYDTATIVDGCGGPGGFSSDPVAPLTGTMIQDVRDSGITCVNFTIGSVGNRPESEAFEAIFRDLAYWENEFDHHPDVFLKVKKFSDVALAKSSRRLGLIFGLQDGVAFANDLTKLEVLSRFGIRIIQPTYNLRNILGDGCLEPDNAGLSKTGHEAIHRMNELGVLVDLSHCGRETTADAMIASTKPVAFTHTGCAAICDHPRNKTDEQLRGLAEKGGVAGIYFMPYLRKGGQQMAEDVIRHLEHAIQVAGEDHVGVGTDGSISPVQLTPEYVQRHKEEVASRRKAGIGAPQETEDVFLFVPDLNASRRFETLGNLLLKRGHSQSRVDKILGGNFARLFQSVWV